MEACRATPAMEGNSARLQLTLHRDPLSFQRTTTGFHLSTSQRLSFSVLGPVNVIVAALDGMATFPLHIRALSASLLHDSRGNHVLKGPIAQGYRTNLWTTARIAGLVEREFGVSYHPDHIGRLMHSLGWSPQKPERRALERDEEEIERWKQEEWPRIKKRCTA